MHNILSSGGEGLTRIVLLKDSQNAGSLTSIPRDEQANALEREKEGGNPVLVHKVFLFFFFFFLVEGRVGWWWISAG